MPPISMAGGVTLPSRVRPGQPPARKTAKGFMALPGEIRNRIYHYYFEDSYRCEIAAKGYRFDRHTTPGRSAQQMLCGIKKDSDPLPQYAISVRISRPLGSRDVNQGLRTIWPSSLCSLILVCKQVHTETIKDFYGRITFVFNAPRRIDNFLSTASALCIQNITRLQLHYIAYGEPRYANDCSWMEKHRKTWRRACEKISKKLTGLQELEIWVHNSHPAPKFNLGVDWVQPLIQFRRLTTSPKLIGNRRHYDDRRAQPVLKTVNVHVDTNTAVLLDPRNRVLTTASMELHRLFGQAISLIILGYSADEAMKEFDAAWTGKYRLWQYHLGYGRIRW
jgi:hypothetical protein